MHAVELIARLQNIVTRYGDKEVRIVLPDLEGLGEAIPVSEFAGELLDIRAEHPLDSINPDGSIWIHVDPPQLD